MVLLSTAPLAVQKQILDQKQRALNKKLQPAPTPRRPMPAVAAPKLRPIVGSARTIHATTTRCA